MSSKRVTDILFDPETCIMTVVYNNCDSKSFSIEGCDDTTPDDEQPGDTPPPFPQDDVRCRVAVKMAGYIVTSRYIDFYNAITPESVLVPPILAGIVTAKIATYTWAITTFDGLYSFATFSLISGDRDTALDEYNTSPTTVINAVAEALYCVLPGSGELSVQVIEAFRTALNDLGSVTYSRLAEFMGIYPLENLRNEAFAASLTVDEVDCDGFDCGDFSGLECADQYITWTDIAENPYPGWYGVNGMINTSAWEGDTTEIGDVPFNTTRTASHAWDCTAPQGQTVGIGVQRVFDPPCTVHYLRGSATKNQTTRIRRICVYRRYDDGKYVVLQNVNQTGLVNTVFSSSWSGDDIAVTEVLWLFITERTDAALHMTATGSQINTD